VNVSSVPRVCVLVTGDEFTSTADAGQGRIFSSNGHMLAAALGQAGIVASVCQVPDDAATLQQAIADAAMQSDVVISTGGASVGDHDLIHEVLEAMQARIHFHGVAQKPGKPMLFAEVEGKPFFGLPGNPRAVLVLFWEYVLPFLRAVQGARDPGPRQDRLAITHDMNVKGERAEFRAATVRDGRVTLLADEGSHMLRSMVSADALAYIPATVRSYRAGDPIEVHYLPR
jgi:molybdopterin molybdotransferase